MRRTRAFSREATPRGPRSPSRRSRTRGLLEGERDELDSQWWRALGEEARELQHPGDAARVVVGAREGPGRVVMCADHDPLRGVRPESGDHVAVRAAADLVPLIRDFLRHLPEPRVDVARHSVEALGMTEVARPEARDRLDVGPKARGIAAGRSALRARAG